VFDAIIIASAIEQSMLALIILFILYLTLHNLELERLKEEEARLSNMLASIRQQKLSVLRSRPLTVGVVGFGRFGQFIGELI